jgi:hypothetical protein
MTKAKNSQTYPKSTPLPWVNEEAGQSSYDY